jgi:hypothetical protein
VAPVEAHAMMTEAASAAAEMGQRMGLMPSVPVAGGVPAGVTGDGNGEVAQGREETTTA